MEKLFLLEVLVENVEIDYTKVDVDKKILDAAKQICIKIQFLSFPELTICEEDFSPTMDGDYQKSSINIKSGKSCLFSIRHWNVEDRSMPLSVTVLRTNPAPPHITVGRACINLGTSFTNILAAAQSTEYTETMTKKCTDVYILTNNSGTDVGKIRLFVRLTCFGPLIVTQFQISGDENNSFLFRGNDGSGIVTFNRNNSGELSEKPVAPVHIPTKQIPCGEFQQPKKPQDNNRPSNCPPCPPCPPGPQDWNMEDGKWKMMPPSGQGMMPQSGQQGMMPPSGQGKMPQSGQQGMMPPSGQGMMPQSGQGMMPQSGQQGMMPQSGQQGMMPQSGQQGMMPPSGQGMMPQSGQGMMPGSGHGMMPWGDQRGPPGGQTAMPVIGPGMTPWGEPMMMGGPVTIMTAGGQGMMPESGFLMMPEGGQGMMPGGGQGMMPGGGQGMMQGGGQGIMPSGGQGMIPGGGQGMMQGGGQGMMPVGGQGMMPQSGQGMMPPSGQGMMPGGQGMMQGGGQGMMSVGGQGMMPQSGQGMIPGGGQGMIPGGGQGMIPGGGQMMPVGGQGMMVPGGEQNDLDYKEFGAEVNGHSLSIKVLRKPRNPKKVTPPLPICGHIPIGKKSSYSSSEEEIPSSQPPIQFCECDFPLPPGFTKNGYTQVSSTRKKNKKKKDKDNIMKCPLESSGGGSLRPNNMYYQTLNNPRTMDPTDNMRNRQSLNKHIGILGDVLANQKATVKNYEEQVHTSGNPTFILNIPPKVFPVQDQPFETPFQAEKAKSKPKKLTESGTQYNEKDGITPDKLPIDGKDKRGPDANDTGLRKKKGKKPKKAKKKK